MSSRKEKVWEVVRDLLRLVRKVSALVQSLQLLTKWNLILTKLSMTFMVKTLSVELIVTPRLTLSLTTFKIKTAKREHNHEVIQQVPNQLLSQHLPNNKSKSSLPLGKGFKRPRKQLPTLLIRTLPLIKTRPGQSLVTKTSLTLWHLNLPLSWRKTHPSLGTKSKMTSVWWQFQTQMSSSLMMSSCQPTKEPTLMKKIHQPWEWFSLSRLSCPTLSTQEDPWRVSQQAPISIQIWLRITFTRLVIRTTSLLISAISKTKKWHQKFYHLMSFHHIRLPLSGPDQFLKTTNLNKLSWTPSSWQIWWRHTSNWCKSSWKMVLAWSPIKWTLLKESSMTMTSRSRRLKLASSKKSRPKLQKNRRTNNCFRIYKSLSPYSSSQCSSSSNRQIRTSSQHSKRPSRLTKTLKLQSSTLMRS